MVRRLLADRITPPLRRVAPGIAFALVLTTVAVVAAADDAAPPPPAVPAAPSAPAEPVVPAVPDASNAGAAASPPAATSFETPEAAAKALLDAFEQDDDAALRALLGAGNDDLVQDGKDPIVRAERAGLAAAAKVKLSLEKQEDGHMVLVVGLTEYPLAIPLALKDGRWRADAAAGRQELLARRIGEHELEAVGVCLAYADAQVAYASKDRNDDGVKEYAQRLVSAPGKKDGLYWDSATDEDPSPAGPGLTPLREALNPVASPSAPFNGYYWRILTAQGANAPGGAYSYVINGRMIAGFALLAVPASHRTTGVMSFLVSNQGKVYEKDLGPDTIKVAAAIGAFDPDASWHEVDETTLRTAAQSSPEDSPFTDKESSSEKSTEATPKPNFTAPASSPIPAPTPTPAPSPCLPKR